MGGRGAGKTRAGAEWVRAKALGLEPLGEVAASRIALVGETMAEVRRVMIEGVSGLLGIHGTGERPRFEPSKLQLVWPSGAIAQMFSAENPEALRGPQFDAAWCDEIAKWRRPQRAWDMLQFGLRLGRRPQMVVTTTPRPIPLLKKLIADAATVVTRAATASNAENVAPTFIAGSADVKFNPDQPRVHAGNTGGGRWTSGGGSPSGRVRLAQADTGIRNDAGEGDTQIAQARGGRTRVGPRVGESWEASPAEEARLAVAEGWAQTQIQRVRVLDPEWHPTPSFVESAEGAIARAEGEAREAEARLAELTRDAIPNTNPEWGVNRLKKELYNHGYVFEEQTRAPGRMAGQRGRQSAVGVPVVRDARGAQNGSARRSRVKHAKVGDGSGERR